MSYRLPDEPHDERPLYQQAKQYVRERVASGEWPHGSKIPSQQELCDELKVSRITISRALQELTQEGLLVSRQGVGTFVSAARRPTLLTNVSELYRRTFGEGADEEKHGHRLLSIRLCNGEVVSGGQLAGREVWCATRVRVVSGKAISFEEAFIDARHVPKDVDVAELESMLLFDFLTVRCRLRLKSTLVQIGAGRITTAQSNVVEAAEDDPALLIRRLSMDVEGNVVAVSVNVHPTNTYNYYFEFQH